MFNPNTVSEKEENVSEGTHLLCRVQRCHLNRLYYRHENSGRMQIADMHYGDGPKNRCRDLVAKQLRSCSDLNTTYFVQRLLAAENPDLVVFTGSSSSSSSSSSLMPRDSLG